MSRSYNRGCWCVVGYMYILTGSSRGAAGEMDQEAQCVPSTVAITGQQQSYMASVCAWGEKYSKDPPSAPLPMGPIYIN